MTVNRYDSKKDAWLIVVLVLAIVASSVASIAALSVGSPMAYAVSIFSLALGVGLPVWLICSTNYTLAQGQLIVRSGPFKWLIPLSDITSVKATSSPLSSPALSIDRLRIDYGPGKTLMVSPRDKEKFIRDIDDAIRETARQNSPIGVGKEN